MLPRTRHGPGLALAAAAVLILPPAAHAAGKTRAVEMRELGFHPATVRAEVGDTVTWTNADLFRHTATARDDSFSVDLVPGAHGSTVLSKPGVIRFYCRFHPDMKGQIVVRARKAR
jgi:plastocyanin